MLHYALNFRLLAFVSILVATIKNNTHKKIWKHKSIKLDECVTDVRVSVTQAQDKVRRILGNSHIVLHTTQNHKK